MPFQSDKFVSVQDFELHLRIPDSSSIALMLSLSSILTNLPTSFRLSEYNEYAQNTFSEEGEILQTSFSRMSIRISSPKQTLHKKMQLGIYTQTKKNINHTKFEYAYLKCLMWILAL